MIWRIDHRQKKKKKIVEIVADFILRYIQKPHSKIAMCFVMSVNQKGINIFRQDPQNHMCHIIFFINYFCKFFLRMMIQKSKR